MTTLRSLTDDEWHEYPSMMVNAFLLDGDPDPASDERTRAVLERDRFLGMYDGDRLIGGAAS